MMPSRRKIEELEEKPSQCHFIHHKSHTDSTGINPGLRRERPATNHLSHNATYPRFNP
jgi:hypothetical protein